MNENELPYEDDAWDRPAERGRGPLDYQPTLPLMPFVDRARRRRGALLSGAALVVFVLFGTVVYASYGENTPMPADGRTPLVTANADPVKVQPEDPGGEIAPDQDSPIHTALLGGQENSAPPTLAPAPPEVRSPARIDAGPPINRVSRDEPAPGGARSLAPEPAAQGGRELLMTDRERMPPPEARPIETDAPEVAATPARTAPPPPAATPAPSTIEQAPVERLASDEPPAPPPPPERAAAELEPLVQAPTPQARPAPPPAPPAQAPSEPEPVVMAAVEPPAAQPQAAPQPAIAPAPGGRFRIQLAAVAAGNGERGWSELLRDHGNILGALSPSFEEIAGRSGPIVRVQAGPFADKASATEACERLKQQNANCFVVGG
ncbi:SPOR domain-containing protein [Marinivivus vitaminiproducens]|uniref:SPOR domain-containing protein n=1 Tax=Marinivivus vitaminiproducens TaxID=3035935 RepID=UPI00279EDB26|nr:SPOR domain-containing protein [Geminicoccaceae bacterium SCSIO 64248]